MNHTTTIIITIIASIFFGAIGPVNSLGFNFPAGNLFSQINSNLPKNNLSEINPIKSLGNVTLPLDTLWKAIGDKLNIKSLDDLKSLLNGRAATETLKEPLKSSLDSSLGLKDSLDSISVWQAFGVVKTVLIKGANILLVVLEGIVSILKWILGLVT